MAEITSSSANPGRSFFIAWLVANVIAWIFIDIILVLTSRNNIQNPLLVSAILLVVNLGLGLALWLVLRTRLPHAGWWLAAHAGGTLLALPLAYWFLPRTFPAYYFHVAALPVIFLVVTVLETVVLWPTGRFRALWWLPVKSLAYMLTPYLSALIVIPAVNQAPLPDLPNTLFILYTGFLTVSSYVGIIPGAVAGGITGLFLRLLMPFPPETAPLSGRAQTGVKS